MGHPVRLKIVVGLCSKCDIRAHMGMSRPAAGDGFQHLALLKNEGIIEGKRDGVKVHYSVVHPLAICRIYKS